MRRNLKYFADTFGKENIVAAHLHRDEETPHIHVTLVPIVKGERKRRKREEQTKKRYRKKPTDTVRLCADDIMTRLKLKSYQDTYAVSFCCCKSTTSAFRLSASFCISR